METITALLSVVLFGTAYAAPTSPQVGGIPLPKIVEHVSKDGALHVELTAMVGRLGANLHGEGFHPLAWDRRSFNGQPNGPTIRVRPGDNLSITLINQLGTEPPGPQGQFYTDKFETNTQNGTHFTGSWAKDYDVYAYINHTNIHTHGLHVSPRGISDNVSRHLPPGGGKLEYLYQIPHDHPTGIFWYHPHFMGSSAVQLASGMAGALIIDDSPETAPAALTAMEEVVMVLHEVTHDAQTTYTNPDHDEMRKLCYFCMDDFTWASGDQLPYNKVINDPVFSQCGSVNTGPDPDLGLKHDPTQRSKLPGFPKRIEFNAFDCTYLLVNGAYRPRLDLKVGVWQRWRIVQSAANSAVRFHLPGCEMQVLAHDGYYLQKPRPIPANESFSLMAGSRADLAIKCNAEGSYELLLEHAGIHVNGTEFSPPFNRQRVKELYEPIIFAPNSTFAAHRTMLTVSVTEGTSEGAAVTLPETLPMNKALRPITDDEVTARFEVVYNLTAYGTPDWHPLLPAFLRKILVYGNGGQFSINGKSFLKTPVRCMMRGEAEEWTVRSAPSMLSKWMHSFHIHVNPFQIVSVDHGDPTQLIREEMQPGDWRDTVHVPDAGSVTFRFRNSDFTGTFPFHCHVVAHQDIGMMQNVMVVDASEECPADVKMSESFSA